MNNGDSQAISRELDRQFGSFRWHTYTRLRRKDGQALCYWCEAPETHRTRCNIWGNVCEVGACAACHLKHHGKWADNL